MNPEMIEITHWEVAPDVWVEEDAQGRSDQKGEQLSRHANWSIFVHGHRPQITPEGYALEADLSDDERGWWMLHIAAALQ